MPNFDDKIGEIYVRSLEGLGASYRLKGIFELKEKDGSVKRINFKGVAFGGHYGGHNVSIEVSAKARKVLQNAMSSEDEQIFEDLFSEIQRRLLNGEMKVDFQRLRRQDKASTEVL